MSHKGSKISEMLPKLTIKAKEGYEDFDMILNNLDIRLDGVPVKGLQGLSLDLARDAVTTATLEIDTRVVVDGRVVQWLEAQVEED